MTRERAQQVVEAQGKFPYWGDYKRFMTAAEIASVSELWRQGPGTASFASVVHRIANA